MYLKQRFYSIIFQILTVLLFGFDVSDSKNPNTNWMDFIIPISKYIYCILLIRGARGTFNYFYSGESTGDILAILEGNVLNGILFSIVTTILVRTDNILVGRLMCQVFVVYLLTDQTEDKTDDFETLKRKTTESAATKKDLEPKGPSISYGSGMACSYFEGYLFTVLPNDGGELHGIENNIKIAEASMGVRFPVKRLFIIITKSMYCPPELNEFNKEDETSTYLEKCTSLSDIRRNVAGVLDRTYRNSVYKLHRRGRRPVCAVAECASPLNTLHKVLQKRVLYQTLANIDVDAVVKDFCDTLEAIIQRSIELRNKVTLVHYDDTDPEQNLADLILKRIEELAPNFERIIEQTD